MTVDEIAAALEGARVGGVPLTKHEARVLAERVSARVKCRCGARSQQKPGDVVVSA